MQSFLIILAIVVPLQCSLAQGTINVSDKLPPYSVELRAKEPPATTTPWQLPKPGDPLYDAEQEALVKDSAHTHVARIYERGVFVGYETVTSSSSGDGLAQKQHSRFTPNSLLPEDVIELSANEQPDKSEYYQEQPKERPANVPTSYVAVRVFQGKTFLGWTYMAKEAVATLHQPD